MEKRIERGNLTEGVIWKKLLLFFFPILFGMLFQQLYATADAIIVGKFVGTDALAAVGGSATQIINLVIGFFTGLASGATVIVSQYFGAKDDERVSLTVHTIITFYIIVGIILAVLGYIFTPWALEAVKNPADIMDLSVEYLRIYFIGALPMLIFNVGSGILRAVGDSKRPLYFLITCCFINIGLDLLFVAVFDYGVAGAGWATVISQTISAILVTLNMCLTNGPHKLHFTKLKIDYYSLRDALWLGIPAGVQSSMYSVSNLIIQSAINGLGTTVIAAWSAVGKLDGLYWTTSNSFGAAICAFVGQCFGARKYGRMKKSVSTCMVIDLGTTMVISGLLLALARPGFSIISDDPEVIEYATEMLFYFAPYYIVWSFIEIISNTLRGAGDSVRPTIIIMLGVCLIRILWVMFVVPNWYTVKCISLSYPVTWSITAVALIIYYTCSGWLERVRGVPKGTPLTDAEN